MELIGKREFATATLYTEVETFLVYVASLAISDMSKVYSSHKASIALFQVDEAFAIILPEYSDFTDVFLPKLIAELSKHMDIHNNAINLVDGNQPPYEPIYSLRPMKLETLKIFIKINLANDFIRSFKSLADALILVVWKPDVSVCLCIND